MRMLHPESQTFWLGTEAAFERYCAAASAMRSYTGAAEAELPELLEIVGNVGIVSIQGSLINGSAGWAVPYGIIGYDDIQLAVSVALQIPDIKSIVLSINSGGGEVAGCDTAASMIAKAATIKPMFTHSDGYLASAAYWLGSSTKRVFATPTTIVGSIGVMKVAIDRTGALEQLGYKAKVIRSGKFKALLNGNEPFTDEAIKQAQDQADAMYAVFASAVGKNMGLSGQALDDAAQGREFVGKQGVTSGLLTGVASLESVLVMAAP